MSDDGQYEDLDFPQLSQEELALLDKEISHAYEVQEINELRAWLSDNPEPALHIVLENSQPYLAEVVPSPVSPPIGTPRTTINVQSPYERHRRRRNALSVTDLTSLAWCELQYDYGLRQMRHLKLDRRPSSFVSAGGKEISLGQVGKDTAASNERTMKKGRSVHKVLEQEIRPEEIRVDVTTDEERWALRLVTMISCLDDLITGGRCREMPVFGVLYDQVITGIIDEIICKPVLRESSPAPPTPNSKRSLGSSHQTPRKDRKCKKPKPSTSPSPTKDASQGNAITTCIDLMSHEPPATAFIDDYRRPGLPLMHTLYIADTKTRRSPSLPPDEDALSSRLQVMLYNRLLSRLLFDFDFPKFWASVGVSPARTLSLRFQEQTSLVLVSGIAHGAALGQTQCLADLTHLLEQRVQQLGINGVSAMMSLVYRTQPITKSTKQKLKQRPPGGVTSALATKERDELEQVVRASLADVGLCDDPGLVHALASSLAEPERTPLYQVDELMAPHRVDGPVPTPLQDDPELSWAIQQSLLPDFVGVNSIEEVSGKVPKESVPTEVEELPTAGFGSQVIGQKEVIMDDSILDAYITRALDWWHGRRKATGVPVDLSRRCFTCEYYEGCEWREQKAKEALNNVRRRHQEPAHSDIDLW